jgi:hypothetical protein
LNCLHAFLWHTHAHTLPPPRRYGGLAAEFYRRVAREYNVTDPTAACFQGEPHVVERTFRRWLAEESITLTTGQTVARVVVDATGQRVVSVELAPSGRIVAVTQLVDASYEGDLLALAGVPTTVGRESATRWNESFGGQLLCSGYEAFNGINVSAVGSSGDLLPSVDGSYPTPWAQPAASVRSDTRVQSYNFRACLTKSKSPGAAAPITRPASYDPADYELHVRYIAALAAAEKTPSLSDFFGCNGYVNGKCDTNDGAALGINPMSNETYSWAEASVSERASLRARFVSYTLGLWWFLANDARVPPNVRSSMSEYSLCADEWADGGDGNLPPIPYIREGRRMVSDDMFTQEDYRARANATLPGAFNDLPRGRSGVRHDSPLAYSVGLGFWFVDCHAVRRTSVGGILRNEGCVQ